MKILLPILTLLIFSCDITKDNKDIEGCIYKNALNYNEKATIDNGSCLFDEDKYPVPKRKPKHILSKSTLIFYELISLFASVILAVILTYKMIIIINSILFTKKTKIESSDKNSFLGCVYLFPYIFCWFYLTKLIFGILGSIPKIHNSIIYHKPDSFFKSSVDFFNSFIQLITSILK